MWLNIDNEKQGLLDKVVEDLPKTHINLYQFLDSDDYLPMIIRNQVSMEQYVTAALEYLDLKDDTRILRNLFVSIYQSVFTKDKYPHQQYLMKVYEFFNGLEDIEYSILLPTDSDYEMVKIMFEKDIELLD